MNIKNKRLVTYDKVDKLIDPIPLIIDLERLKKDVIDIGNAVGYTENGLVSGTEIKHNQSTINFTHPKNIPQACIDKNGEFRSKFVGLLTSGQEYLMRNFNLSTEEFTEMDDLVTNSYLKVVTDQLQDYHTKTYGKGQIRWIHGATLGPSASFHLHIDPHTTIRYHIALTTNDYSFMMAEDGEEIKVVNIPADGRVWFLETNVNHNAINISPSREIRTHLIFSVYDI